MPMITSRGLLGVVRVAAEVVVSGALSSFSRKQQETCQQRRTATKEVHAKAPRREEYVGGSGAAVCGGRATRKRIALRVTWRRKAGEKRYTGRWHRLQSVAASARRALLPDCRSWRGPPPRDGPYLNGLMVPKDGGRTLVRGL